MKAGALNLFNKLLESENHPTFEKARKLLLKCIKLPGGWSSSSRSHFSSRFHKRPFFFCLDYGSRIAKACGKSLVAHLTKLVSEPALFESEIDFLQIVYLLSPFGKCFLVNFTTSSKGLTSGLLLSHLPSQSADW